MDNKKFSVVMSVYRGDIPRFFAEAVASVINQTLPPSELIIVVDGPVDPCLDRAILLAEYEARAKILRLEKNHGLGYARHRAVLAAKYSIVAVMDSDDISAHNRFEHQMVALERDDVDIVGGFIEEFNSFRGDCSRVRVVPLTHDEIIRFAHWRQPMNHVTIMFRRSAYDRAGGYRSIRGIEDFDLFHRMFICGVRFCNLPMVLVHVRCGESVLLRRRGISYLRQELGLMWRMKTSGFLSFYEWARNSVVRACARALPPALLGRAYLWMRRR